MSTDGIGMRHVTAAAALLGLTALAAGPAHAQKAAAQATVTLKDGAGDVRGGADNFDVVEVGLDSDGQNLVVSATLAADVVTLMKSRNAGEALRMFLDTDDNPATGGAVTWAGERKGFEARIGVNACVTYAEGAACAGGLKGSPVTGYFAGYDTHLWKADEDEGSFEFKDSVMAEGGGSVAGKVLKVYVPYSAFGLRAGQVVRVAVREQDGEYDASAVMPDARLKLK